MKYFESKSLESFYATIGVNAQWRHLSDAIGTDKRFRVIKCHHLCRAWLVIRPAESRSEEVGPGGSACARREDGSINDRQVNSTNGAI